MQFGSSFDSSYDCRCSCTINDSSEVMVMKCNSLGPRGYVFTSKAGGGSICHYTTVISFIIGKGNCSSGELGCSRENMCMMIRRGDCFS